MGRFWNKWKCFFAPTRRVMRGQFCGKVAHIVLDPITTCVRTAVLKACHASRKEQAIDWILLIQSHISQMTCKYKKVCAKAERAMLPVNVMLDPSTVDIEPCLRVKATAQLDVQYICVVSLQDSRGQG